MREMDWKDWNILFLKSWARLYSFIFFSRRASKKIPMRLKTTSFLCNAIETKQRNNSFKSCLALWPMRLLLVFIPTPKTKIFGSGPNKTKSPNGWFLLFARRMSWQTANSFRISLLSTFFCYVRPSFVSHQP